MQEELKDTLVIAAKILVFSLVACFVAGVAKGAYDKLKNPGS